MAIHVRSEALVLPQILEQRMNEIFGADCKGAGECDSGVGIACRYRTMQRLRQIYVSDVSILRVRVPLHATTILWSAAASKRSTGELMHQMLFPVIRSHNSVEAFFSKPA
jgi:hypothetical protein